MVHASHGGRGVFNDPMDGIIYGSMVGIGAAVAETYGLLGEIEGWLPGSEIVRVFGHGIFGGFTGFGIGLYIIRHPHRHVLLGMAFASSITLHYFGIL